MRIHSINSDSLANGFSKLQVAAAISPRFQELILLPTEKCNFRCTYCYEDFELGVMSQEVQRGIELFLDERIHGLLKLDLSWFGGEPLVAKAVVLRLSRYAKALCDKHNVKLGGGLTTNAYLLDKDTAVELLECNMDFFQITLDGWGEMHDAVRRRADGRGTFDVIWNNLIELKHLDRQFECSVRIHVRRDNVDNLKILMRQYAQEFGRDPRFYLNFQHLRNLGGTGGKTVVDGISQGELASIEAELRQEVLGVLGTVPSSISGGGVSGDAERMSEGVFVSSLEHNEGAGESASSARKSEMQAGTPYICYAAKPNSLLIRSNGRIGKCTVAFDDERNDIGQINSDGTITVDNEKLQPWIRGLGTLEPLDLGCPIQKMNKQRSGGQSLGNIPIVAKML
jgi:uncharacterized protein